MHLKKKELNMCGSVFVYVVPFKHYYAKSSCFPLNLCQIECGWDKF